MKRYLALIIAGGLTTLAAVVVLTAILTSLSPTLTATAAGAEVPAEAIPSGQTELENWQAEVEANTQAVNQQIETTFQEREAAWQTRITQQKENLNQLDSSSQAQLLQLEVQFKDFQAQIEQTGANLADLQNHAAALQQAIQDDNTTYQNQLAAITTAEAQLRQEVDNAYAQLNAAYEALAQRQAAAASGQGGGSGGGGSHDDDGHKDHGGDDDDHEEHEHEDDDD